MTNASSRRRSSHPMSLLKTPSSGDVRPLVRVGPYQLARALEILGFDQDLARAAAADRIAGARADVGEPIDAGDSLRLQQAADRLGLELVAHDHQPDQGHRGTVFHGTRSLRGGTISQGNLIRIQELA